MTVSVVVPVRNGASTLGKCLTGLAAQATRPQEVIVVDNGSRDGSGDLARAFAASVGRLPIQVLEEPRPGASVARNRGVAVASGDVIAFTDVDCEPAPDWLGRLTSAFGPGIGAVAGHVKPAPPRTAIEAVTGLYTLRTGTTPFESAAFSLMRGGFPTANLAVRRDVCTALGGFDERIPIYGEDYDLCARIYKHGWAIRYDPSAVVFHQHRMTLGGVLKQGFGFGSCHAYLLRQHCSRKFLVEIPALRWECDRLPGKIWLDLASADKKLAGLLAVSVLFPAAWVTVLGYLGYLYVDASRRFDREEYPVSRSARLSAPLVLLAKSAAMTTGRLVGSVRFGAVCL